MKKKRRQKINEIIMNLKNSKNEYINIWIGKLSGKKKKEKRENEMRKINDSKKRQKRIQGKREIRAM